MKSGWKQSKEMKQHNQNKWAPVGESTTAAAAAEWQWVKEKAALQPGLNNLGTHWGPQVFQVTLTIHLQSQQRQVYHTATQDDTAGVTTPHTTMNHLVWWMRFLSGHDLYLFNKYKLLAIFGSHVSDCFLMKYRSSFNCCLLVRINCKLKSHSYNFSFYTEMGNKWVPSIKHI